MTDQPVLKCSENFACININCMYRYTCTLYIVNLNISFWKVPRSDNSALVYTHGGAYRHVHVLRSWRLYVHKVCNESGTGTASTYQWYKFSIPMIPIKTFTYDTYVFIMSSIWSNDRQNSIGFFTHYQATSSSVRVIINMCICALIQLSYDM